MQVSAVPVNSHHGVGLQQPVSFTDTIRPICLPPVHLKNVSPEGTVMVVGGWGLDDAGKKSDALRVLQRTGIGRNECKSVYGKYITGHHICTSGKDRKHICIGDSGSPLMMEVEGRMVVRGVVSFTGDRKCKNTKPDAHSSVPHFLAWIVRVIGIAVPQ